MLLSVSAPTLLKPNQYINQLIPKTIHHRPSKQRSTKFDKSTYRLRESGRGSSSSSIWAHRFHGNISTGGILLNIHLREHWITLKSSNGYQRFKQIRLKTTSHGLGSIENDSWWFGIGYAERRLWLGCAEKTEIRLIEPNRSVRFGSVRLYTSLVWFRFKILKNSVSRFGFSFDFEKPKKPEPTYMYMYVCVYIHIFIK